MRGLYDRFCVVARDDPGKPVFMGSAFTGTITRLLPATARKLASEYFQLLRAGDRPTAPRKFIVSASDFRQVRQAPARIARPFARKGGAGEGGGC